MFHSVSPIGGTGPHRERAYNETLQKKRHQARKGGPGQQHQPVDRIQPEHSAFAHDPRQHGDRPLNVAEPIGAR